MDETDCSTNLQSTSRSRFWPLIAFLLVDLVLSIVILAGVPHVPFHPDESTFLFLSADFERLFTNPAGMAWQPELRDDLVQRYRTLDAPLGRYLVGFGRWLTGQAPLPVDWEWGKTWQQNQQAGALPSEGLLLAGRYALAGLLPFSLLLTYLTGRRAGGEAAGWLAALLLAGNALVLMLGRRAVSEGTLVFTSSLTLFSLLYAHKRPWLTGPPAGLAFCAKHSLGALAPIGLLAIFWQPRVPLAVRLRQAAFFIGLYAVVVIALNPFAWQHPLAALQDAAENRRVLAANQTADRPEQALTTHGLRIIGMLGALYLTPPILAETANYVKDTQAQDLAYLANPFNRMLRSLPAGGLLLIITLAGWLASVWQVARKGGRGTPALAGDRRSLTLLLLAAALQAAALYVLVPLPFQRYYLPLVPHACLWAAIGLLQIFRPFVNQIEAGRQRRPTSI